MFQAGPTMLAVLRNALPLISIYMMRLKDPYGA